MVNGFTGRSHDDRGQVLPMVGVAVFLVVAIALLVVVGLGHQTDDRARAQSAADAAALAGARDGEGAARSIAAANHAGVESFAIRGGEVEVIVRVGRSTATARARREW
jgi:uncharacterized membrane protein